MQKYIFVLVAVCLGAAEARAEELYDFACCPNDDCRSSEIDQVTPTLEGWNVSGLDEVIRFGDSRIRTSRDRRWINHKWVVCMALEL
jgi:hypothetical protein